MENNFQILIGEIRIHTHTKQETLQLNINHMIISVHQVERLLEFQSSSITLIIINYRLILCI